MRRFITNHHRWLLRVAQISCFALAGIGAFLLRFDFQIPPKEVPHIWVGIAVWVVVKSFVFYLFKSDRSWWRYVSIHDLVGLGFANVTGTAISGAAILLLSPAGFPRSIYILDGILCFGFTAGMRIVIRVVYELGQVRVSNGSSQRTVIYGAGEAGIGLLREIRHNPALPYTVAGFIDDDAAKRGFKIQGVPVLGDGEAIPELSRKHDIDTMLIAVPSATGAQMTRILQLCTEAGVKYKTIPGMGEVIEGHALAPQIRDVAVEDLLGRDPVRLDTERIADRYRGKVVMITGAAGSIGSELCRQIARFRPAAIVGYEVAETPLFFLEAELKRSFPGMGFHAEMGCVLDNERLDEVFERHAPSAVFHAAAYKHVPMMEANVFSAIRNNVFGTANVATAAARFGVEDFVMVSTDKAVRPTSIMGVSKRVAELLVHSLSADSVRVGDLAALDRALRPATKFVSVRFGNVLGSNGSVIPIFKQQIAAGGPVTVTHPEMRRYFMTIPEASQLVLQASTMGIGGEIFVLDMGQPVKIVDLARNLILLSGLKPGEDIEIAFTGVRPGEKLYEELNSSEEEHLPTTHEKILIFAGNGLPSKSMAAYLGQLQEICFARDVAELVLMLKEMVPDYNPSSELLKRTMYAATPEAEKTNHRSTETQRI